MKYKIGDICYTKMIDKNNNSVGYFKVLDIYEETNDEKDYTATIVVFKVLKTICGDLDDQYEGANEFAVGSYFCESTKVLKDVDKQTAKLLYE